MTTTVLAERTFPELGALDTRERLDELGAAGPVLLVRHRASRARSRCTTTRAPSRASSGRTASIGSAAATDVLRIRERGVPRYNEFRRLLQAAGRTFEELTDNPRGPRSSRGLRRRRHVDLMVGMYAEPLRAASASATPRSGLHPDGLAPAEERPLLHARLHAEVYTRRGPTGSPTRRCATCSCGTTRSLAPALEGVENAFAPWTRGLVALLGVLVPAVC